MRKALSMPWFVVLLITAITVFFALQLPKAVMDNDTTHFIPPSDPNRGAFDRVEKIFPGSQLAMMVGMKAPGKSVLEGPAMEDVRRLTKIIEDMDGVGQVTSISNADFVRAEGDSLVVEDIVPKTYAGTPAEIRDAKRRILSWDMYAKALVSSDFRTTQITVGINQNVKDNDAEDYKAKVYRGVQDAIRGLGLVEKGWEVHITGAPVIASLMSETMRHDLVVLIPLVILVVVVVLFLSFRRVEGVALPLVSVLISTIWTIGLMALLGSKLTVISTTLPVIMVAIGSAYGIHVISHYYDAAARAAFGADRDRQFAVMMENLGTIGQPVFLAALTTMAGFGSLSFTRIVPLFEFGLYSTFGVAVAWIVSILLLPALILIRGPGRDGKRKPVTETAEEEHLHDPVARGIAGFFLSIFDRPRATLIVFTLIVAVAVIGAAHLIIDNSLIDYFRSDTAVAKADVFVRREFGGSKVFSVLVNGPEKGSMNDPAALAAMDDLTAYIQSFPKVGKVLGYPQLVKRMNQVLHADEPADGVRPRAASAEQSAAAGSSNEEPAFGFDSLDSAPAAAPSPVQRTMKTVKPREAQRVANVEDVAELLNAARALAPSADIRVEDLIGLVNKSANFEGSAYYEIPTDPARYGKADKEELKALIANYLVLLTSGTKNWSDDPLEPSIARIAVVINAKGNLETAALARSIREYARSRFPAGYTVETAGIAIIEKAIADMIVSSQIASIASSILLIFLILWVYYKSLAAGILGTLPLAATILVDFAIMGFAGINLDIGTAMTASISVGAGIDYTIHMTSGYQRERLADPAADARAIARRALLGSGKAITFNAVSVAAGFAVLAFSSFRPLTSLGMLIAVTMLTSSFVSMSLLPVLFALLKPKFLATRPLF